MFDKHSLKLDIVNMADVERSPVRFLWSGWLAQGKTHLMVGDPGVGKSFVTVDLAARMTTGRNWPDDSGPAEVSEVMFLIGEDGLADTIRPRLDEAGADCSKVHVIRGRRSAADDGGSSESQICLSTDADLIDAELERRPGIRVLFIDPVSEFIGGVDSHKNAEVRAVLGTLSRLAERRNVAVVNVTHFSKSHVGSAMHRSMGSIGFVAQARLAWGHFRDDENVDRVLMLPLKNNLSKRVSGLAYKIVDGTLCGRVQWEDSPVDVLPDEAMEPGQHRRKGKLADATAWLRDRLATGSVESKQLDTEADDAGIAKKTLWRARMNLGVVCTKSRTAEGTWLVHLPGDGDSKAANHSTSTLDHIDCVD